MTYSFGATRRAFLLGTSALGATMVLAPRGWAQDFPDDAADQAEWVQSYDAATSKTLDRSISPLLSPGTVTATEAAAEAFKGLVARGGWPEVANRPLKLGMQEVAQTINCLGRS